MISTFTHISVHLSFTRNTKLKYYEIRQGGPAVVRNDFRVVRDQSLSTPDTSTGFR